MTQRLRTDLLDPAFPRRTPEGFKYPPVVSLPRHNLKEQEHTLGLGTRKWVGVGQVEGPHPPPLICLKYREAPPSLAGFVTRRSYIFP